VLPEQLASVVQVPLLEQRRGVAPTQERVPGVHEAHLLLTQTPLVHSLAFEHASPIPQLPQLIPGPEQEFKLTNAPASLHWWATPPMHSAFLGTQSTQAPVAGKQ
jgi:hypothetical protein